MALTGMVHQAIVLAGKYALSVFDLVSTAVRFCASAETALITGQPCEVEVHTNGPVIVDDLFVVKRVWFPDGRFRVSDIPCLVRSIFCNQTDANHRKNDIGARLIDDRHNPAPRWQGD